MKFLLIVSHESSVQESLRMILKEDFYVLSAKTGSEALMMMAQHPVDVVLLDSNLPDYKGLSLMEKVREISEVIPLVIISSTKGPGPLVDMKAGYCEILVKPFERDEVQWVVKKALHHRQLLRELELARSRGDTAQEARYALAQAQEIPSYPIHVGSLYPSGRELFGLHYALKDFFKALTHITDLERLLDFILHAVAELFQVNKASVSLFESSQYHYRVRGALGLDETRLATLVFKATEGLPAWFLRYNRILRKEDIERDAFSKEAALLNDQLEALDAKISAPLLAKGKLVGIISLGNKVTGRTFSEADVELLSMISNYTAMAIENSLLYREISLQKSYNENLLKNIASGVIAIDTRGRVTTYNPAAARIIGVSRQEVLGKAVQKLGSVFADILLRTVEGNEIFSRYEVAHPMTKAPLGVSTSLLRDETNRVKGAVMVFTDLSETKELEAKTRDLERLRFWSILANRMAQEIRNPLVAVKTFAQLLPERYDDEEFRNEFYRVVTGEVDRLNRITESLLELAQPRETRFEKEDVNALVTSLLQAKMDQMRAQNTRLISHISSEPMYIKMDRASLTKAIAHIVDNSLEAMPDGGKLKVKTQRISMFSLNGRPAPLKNAREWVEIEIEDTGRGIAEENLEEIFSPFFTTKIKGMGFGLPIAQRIVQDHRGKIEAETTEGKGSKFRIFLPFDFEPEPAPPFSNCASP